MSRGNTPTGLFTQSGHPLTAQEAKFIEVYTSGSTQTQAYREAYNETDSAKIAAGARKVIRKPYILEEIKCRMEQAKTESIATMTEVMEYFTGVMKGDIKDAFGLEASLSERTKAAVELAKRLSVLEDRAVGQQEPPKLVIEVDWARNKENQATSENLPHRENTEEGGTVDGE